MSRAKWYCWWTMWLLVGGEANLSAGEPVPALTSAESRALSPFRATFSKIEEIWRTAGREGDVAAFEKAKSAQEKSPNLAPGIDVYVEMAYRTRRLDEALAFYQGRAQVPGEGPMPFYALGRIHLLRQEYPQALLNGRIALEKGCIYWGCAPVVAEAQRQVGQWEEGVQWLRQRITKGRAETRGTVWLTLAEFYLWDDEDDPTAGEEALNTAIPLLSFGRGLERALWVEGELALREGRLVEAERALRRCAAAFEAMGDRASLSLVQHSLIRALRQSGRPEEAGPLLEEVFTWQQETGQASAARLTQLDQARTLAEQGRPLSAEAQFRVSITRCREEDLPLVLVGVADLARLWQGLGYSGEQILAKLDEVMGATPPAALVPGLALLKAAVAADAGLVPRVMEAAGQAENSATQDATRALALTFKVRAYQLQGQVTPALATYDQALALMTRSGGSAADLHFDRAELLLSVGEPRAALKVLQQAAKDELEGGDPALILFQLARAYVAMGTPERASTLVEEAVTTALETGRPSLAAAWLAEMGPGMVSPELLQLVRQVLVETGDPLARAQVATLLSRQHLAKGEVDEAYTLLQEAQTLLGLDPAGWSTAEEDTLRRQCQVLGSPLLALRWSTAIDLSLAEVSLRGGNLPPHPMSLPWASTLTREPLPRVVGVSAADILRVREVGRDQPLDAASTLSLLTSLEPPPPLTPFQRAELGRAGHIFAQLARALGTADVVSRLELSSAISLVLGLAPPGEVQLTHLRVLAMTAWQSLVAPLAVSPPTSLPSPNNTLLSRVRAGLKSGERALVMVPGDQQSYAWVITTGEVVVVPLGGVAHLGEVVKKLPARVSQVDGVPAELAEFAWPLGEVLLQPLLAHLPSGTPTVVWTPPSWRHLPWEILPVSPPGEVITWWGAYAPLTFVGQAPPPPVKARPAADAPWLLVGDPAYLEDRCGLSPSIRASPPAESRASLLGDHPDRMCRAPVELTTILETRSRRSRTLDVVLAGTAATEEGVRPRLGESFAVVHFSTRAQAWSSPSGRTSVQLGLNLFEETATTPEGDGYLEGVEWSTLGAHPSLVMITGSEAAQEEVSTGTWPLASMILAGGTSQVVLSSWWVGDPGLTQQVGEFYALLPAEGAALALYHSRLRLLTGPEIPPPAVWASLRLYEAR